MTLGVIIGVLLLILLVGLVVLQGLIEWGGFDTDRLFKFAGKSKDSPADKSELKEVSKPIVKKGAKKTAKKTAKKKKGAK